MQNKATDECGPKRGPDAGAEHKLPEHEHPELSTELGPFVEPTRVPLTADLSEDEVVITLSSASSSSSAPTVVAITDTSTPGPSSRASRWNDMVGGGQAVYVQANTSARRP